MATDATVEILCPNDCFELVIEAYHAGGVADGLLDQWVRDQRGPCPNCDAHLIEIHD